MYVGCLPADNNCMGAQRRWERGATGIEVALIITFVALLVFSAARLLGTRSSDKIHEVGQGIHHDAGDGGGTATPPVDGSGGGGPMPTDPPVGPPASTAAPTTPPPTTTPPTTAPPTTTTAPPPTTTVPPSIATAALADGTATVTSSTTWSASSRLTITDQFGGTLPGTEVTVLVRRKRINSNGSSTWLQTTVTGTIGADGTLLIETGPYKRSGSNRITTVEYTVQSVTVQDGGTWNGDQPSISIPSV